MTGLAPAQPVITLIGLSVPALLAGNLIVKTVFNYEGLGMIADPRVRLT